MNIINKKCPHCSHQKADVLAIINGKILYRCCTGNVQLKKSCQYTTLPNDNTDWEQFFGSETVSKLK